MPIDEDKAKSAKDTKNEQKSNKKAEFKNFDNFLPDHKGNIKVCIIGGSESAIYTAVLLKQSRLIKRIHLVDTKGLLSGAILDANHIDTSARIKYFKKKFLKQALKDVSVHSPPSLI